MRLGCLYPRGPLSHFTVMPVTMGIQGCGGCIGRRFGLFTAFRMTGGAASVILRSEATKNPKPLREYCVYILINETHRLHIESVGSIWVDLNAERSAALDSSLRSE